MEDGESMMDPNREDGELEDGELTDEDDSMPTLPPVVTAHADVMPVEKFHSPPVLSAQDNVAYRAVDTEYPQLAAGDHESHLFGHGNQPEESAALADDDKEEGEADEGSFSGHSDDDKDKKKRGRKRDKKRKRKFEDKPRRRKKFHDYDLAAAAGDQNNDNLKSADDPYLKAWPGFGNKRRDRGSYESHEDKDRSPDTRDQDMRDDPRARRTQRAYDEPYGSPGRDNMYASPPGPYDSPDEGNFDEGRKKSKYSRFGGTMPSSHNEERHGTLLSMVGDEFMDANVAANEKEELFDRSNNGGKNSARSQRRIEKSKKYKETQRTREKEYADRDRRHRDDRKRQACRQYQDGHCPRGEDCDYSHEGVQKRELGHKKVLCKHYLRGGCNRDWCIFMHGDYPCKYYFQNRCELGDRCRFTHGDLTDEFNLIMDRDNRDVSPKRNGQIRKPGNESKYETTNKSSLLGDPPAHIKEQVKKIPSLFDIKVEKPKGPTNQNMMPPNMGPNMGAHMPQNQRPGFYSDMMNTPPRMGGPVPPGTGLLGAAPPTHMHNMSIPPPGFIGPPLTGPAQNFMPPPGNFYGAMGPPPNMGPSMGVGDNHEGQMDHMDNALDGGSMRQGHLSNDDWNNQEQGDSWFEGDANMADSMPPITPQPAAQSAQSTLDLSAMLTMIRNSVVGNNPAASSPQPSAPAPTPAVRDPRSSGVSDPRASRADPRSRDPESHVKQPPIESIKVEPVIKTEATFGFAQHQVQIKQEVEAIEPEITNCSLSYTGGVPYLLYKITVDVLRPMLPKSIDPNNAKYVDDPRIKRYGRVGQAAVITEPKMIRPRQRLGSLDNAAELKSSLVDPDNAAISKSDSAVTPITAVFEPKKEDEFKAATLPDGLKKPLIPLPKLLDPRLGRQLSLDQDKTKTDRTTSQKSPPIANRPAQPFSHRNDPRFRKKSKGRSNSTGDGDNNQNTNEQTSGTDSDVSPEKLYSDIDSKSNTDKDLADDTEHKTDSEPVQQKHYNPREEIRKSGRGDNPMEYATPLGYYSEMNNDSSSYDSYSSKPMHKKDTAVNLENSRYHRSSPPLDRSSPPMGDSVDPLTSVYNDSLHADSIYSMAASTAETPSYVPMKDMFKTIDPTASPFGSIS